MDGKASWKVSRFPMGSRVLMFCDKEDLIETLKFLNFHAGRLSLRIPKAFKSIL